MRRGTPPPSGTDDVALPGVTVNHDQLQLDEYRCVLPPERVDAVAQPGAVGVRGHGRIVGNAVEPGERIERVKARLVRDGERMEVAQHGRELGRGGMPVRWGQVPPGDRVTVDHGGLCRDLDLRDHAQAAAVQPARNRELAAGDVE